jgi:cytochrome c556
MRPHALTISILLAASWSILGIPGAKPARADAHGDRQAVMRANGAAISAIDAQVIGILNPATVKAQAQILIDNGARITTLFGPGTDQNDPGAQPVLWTDAVGFKAANDKFIADAKTFLAAPDRIAFAHALVTVQADCAACHKTYRVMPAAGAGRGAPPANAPANQ